MRIGSIRCVIPTWNVVTISHPSSNHKTLGREPGNGGVVPPWLEPPSNFVPLPGPVISAATLVCDGCANGSH